MKITQSFALALCILSCSVTYAQKGNFSTLLTGGVATPILDNGIGYHIGLNPCWSLSNHISIEGQLSYAAVEIDGAFISGAQGTVKTFNALAGGRLYILSPEKNVRPYINLLLGGMLSDDQSENTTNRNPEFGVGLSTGAFLEIKRFVVGVSFDTPSNLILKAGYNF